MERAFKLQVNIGKDHTVKLPSDLPEGPAEVIVIPRTSQPTPGARALAFGRYEGSNFHIAPDFDAPLPDEILSAFEGADSGTAA